MNQTNHFFDLGYGWLCKHCSAEDAERNQHPHSLRATTPGDVAEKAGKPQLALATWTDSTRHVLTCPRCGVEEVIN